MYHCLLSQPGSTSPRRANPPLTTANVETLVASSRLWLTFLLEKIGEMHRSCPESRAFAASAAFQPPEVARKTKKWPWVVNTLDVTFLKRGTFFVCVSVTQNVHTGINSGQEVM